MTRTPTVARKVTFHVSPPSTSLQSTPQSVSSDFPQGSTRSTESGYQNTLTTSDCDTGDPLDISFSSASRGIMPDDPQWNIGAVENTPDQLQDFRQGDAEGHSSLSDLDIVQTHSQQEPYDNRDSERSGATTLILLAVKVRGRTLGCAYYDAHVSQLFVMQDMRDCSVVEVINMIKMQVQPTLILTTHHTEEMEMEALARNDANVITNVDVRPSGEFGYAMAKSRLISVVMANSGWGAHATPLSERGAYNEYSSSDLCRGAQLFLAHTIDMDSTESIGCAGAVISHLSRTSDRGQRSRKNDFLGIFGLAMFTIDAFMYINANTQSSLLIFEDETHPNMHSGARGRKEGLSLFGVMNCTKTPQGRYRLRQWFMRPLRNLKVLRDRHQTIQCFVRPENKCILDELLSCLAHIKDISRVLHELLRSATMNEWQTILQFAFYVLKIHGHSQEVLFSDAKVMQDIRSTVQVQELRNVGALIDQVVDFDESVVQSRCVVKYHVDEQLDRMRRTYDGLDSFLSEIASEISLTLPTDFAPTINVIYFPQLGYLITIPMNPNWCREEHFIFDGLQYQFSTQTTVYYKNDAMRELDKHLGDIHGLIVDREIEILHVLQGRILDLSPALISANDLCAELDALLSLALVAQARNYCCPTLTEDHVLEITNGRHPLQELCVDSFVTNDTHMGCSESISECSSQSQQRHFQDCRTVILYGANCSGKSVYLKQVALITFMAHIGSFVPADSALIGLTDKILTRVQTRETVSSMQSAFMTDLQQVALAIRMSTRRSLLILDEIGKGTATCDGAGMFCGVIEHLASRGVDRPMVLATTHFHELLENQLLNTSLPIQHCMMQVIPPVQGGQGAVFLFKVSQGREPMSLGIACAASAGLSWPVVDRAEYLTGLFRRYEVVVPQLTVVEQRRHGRYKEVCNMLLQLDLGEAEASCSMDKEAVGSPNGCANSNRDGWRRSESTNVQLQRAAKEKEKAGNGEGKVKGNRSCDMTVVDQQSLATLFAALAEN